MSSTMASVESGAMVTSLLKDVMPHPSSALTGGAAANIARATAVLASRRRPAAAVIAGDLTYCCRPVTNIRHDIRNVAIIAHVDHGKTTLVYALLKPSHTFRDNQQVGPLIIDNSALERDEGPHRLPD